MRFRLLKCAIPPGQCSDLRSATECCSHASLLLNDVFCEGSDIWEGSMINPKLLLPLEDSFTIQADGHPVVTKVTQVSTRQAVFLKLLLMAACLGNMNDIVVAQARLWTLLILSDVSVAFAFQSDGWTWQLTLQALQT